MLNQYSWLLLLLVLESNLACYSVFNRGWSEEIACHIGIITDFIGFLCAFYAVHLCCVDLVILVKYPTVTDHQRQ